MILVKSYVGSAIFLCKAFVDFPVGLNINSCYKNFKIVAYNRDIYLV